MKLVLFLVISFVSISLHAQTPIALHPKNPHYFIFRDKPTALITSGEHYGAVMNSELDYITYLNVMEHYGFNLTRTFMGDYGEGNEINWDPSKVRPWEEIQNTLAPRPGKLLAPWVRSSVAGFFNGGNKFDLDRWDEKYFQRLKDFCNEAGKRGIVVEVVLFTANYSPENWLKSPLNAQNNINATENIVYNEVHLLSNTKMIKRQRDMVQKIVQELNGFDNIYFEICNEPYWLKGIPEVNTSIKEQQFLPEIGLWQDVITQTITETEKQLPKKHLIAQNVANTYLKVAKAPSSVSVLNFHYAYPPRAVTDNYPLNLPIAYDETSDGSNAPNKRREAWAFMLAGGSVYSNLDFSFATDDMTGLGRNPTGRRQSSKEVREQLSVLHSTIQSFDFVNAKPIDDSFRAGLPSGLNLYGLSTASDHLFYWIKTKKTEITFWKCTLEKGDYIVQWMDPINGSILFSKTQTSEGSLSLGVPSFSDDIVLRLTRVK